jgi:TMEM175 potassium channel family protein
VDSRRAESFSDGVFAVAITILVFNLLPIGNSKTSALTWNTLAAAWPSYFAYVVSFVTIGIMWLNHHGMLAQIRLVDRPLLVLNLALLLGIVALPFPTALVAEHMTGSQPPGSAVAVVLYGINLIVISVVFGSTWLYETRHARGLGGSAQLRLLSWSTLRFTAGNFAYVAGTLIAAFSSPIAGLAIFGLVAVYYLFEHLPAPAGGTDADSDSDG